MSTFIEGEYPEKEKAPASTEASSEPIRRHAFYPPEVVNQEEYNTMVEGLASPKVSVPVLLDAALHGVAGEIVNKIAPHTEAHPAALLIQLLVGMGNLIGRDPYFQTERTKHHTNLFTVIVGDSSRGRKGTSWDHVLYLLEQVDPTWAGTQIIGGLASGEGVIAELRDSSEECHEAKDKRLVIKEGEFSQALQVMSRAGNTVSALLRNAWDTGNLKNMSKGQPLQASNCHISMIGHITKTELRRLLSANDTANGFANRILWVRSERVRLLPDGGDIQSVDFSQEVKKLCQIAESSRRVGEVKRTPEAGEYWHHLYINELSTGDAQGIWGQVTDRAEAQVVRLSLLFAIMDLSRRIELKHIKAAKAVWDYSFKSAQWVFSDSPYSANGKRLLESLQCGPLTKTQITHGVFQKHLQKEESRAVLEEIKDKIITQKIETRGKPTTLVSLRNPVEE
jgi:hypothetical protein